MVLFNRSAEVAFADQASMQAYVQDMVDNPDPDYGLDYYDAWGPLDCSKDYVVSAEDDARVDEIIQQARLSSVEAAAEAALERGGGCLHHFCELDRDPLAQIVIDHLLDTGFNLAGSTAADAVISGGGGGAGGGGNDVTIDRLARYSVAHACFVRAMNLGSVAAIIFFALTPNTRVSVYDIERLVSEAMHILRLRRETARIRSRHNPDSGDRYLLVALRIARSIMV